MAPAKAKPPPASKPTSGPIHAQTVRVQVEEISVRADVSGWRDADPVRVAELATLFRDGGYLQTITSRPKLLSGTQDAAQASSRIFFAFALVRNLCFLRTAKF